MTIKFEITMTNKWLYSLIAVGIFLALGVGVWAYNSEGPPSVMGHSAEELEVNVSGTLMNLQQAIDQGNLSSGWKHVGAVLYNQQVPNSSWNILDLSSYVGSKNSLVMFKAYSSHASNLATISFRTNGEAKNIGYQALVPTNAGAGASRAQVQDSVAYLVVETDSQGMIEFRSTFSNIPWEITFIGFI
jgi:hypothetical protein